MSWTWDVYYEEADGNDPRKWIGTIQAVTGGEALRKASQYFEFPSHDLVVKQKEDDYDSPQARAARRQFERGMNGEMSGTPWLKPGA